MDCRSRIADRGLGSRREIFLFDDKEKMSEFMIGKWKEILREAIEKRGIFIVALSGGKTPVHFYRRLANMKEAFPWNKTHVFPVDERFVSFTAKESNFGMLKKTLLDKVPVPPENIHPIPAERSTPQISAMEYEEDLRIFFKLSKGQFPQFDLILLGIGEDGHTASLFPGSPLLNEQIRLAAPVILDKVRHPRVTLTLPAINHSRNVLFLVTGKNKAAVLKSIFDEGDDLLPASRVKPDGNLIFLIDQEAGSLLNIKTVFT